MSRANGTSVVHPVISTSDLAATTNYYRTVLGLLEQPTTRHDPALLARLSGLADPSARAVILRAPAGGEIERVQVDHPIGKLVHQHSWPDAGIKSVTFLVDDLRQSMARVNEAGYRAAGEVVRTASPDGEHDVVYVTAPEGVILTLAQQVVDNRAEECR